MAAPAQRKLAQVGLGLCLLVAAGESAGASKLKLSGANAQALTFAALNGWRDDDHAAAYAAFQKSCGAIKHGTMKMRAARPVYGALFNVCARAIAAGNLDRDQARAFFEDNFKPVRLSSKGQEQGFYTGYYEPVVEGSRVKTEEYSVPLYTAPAHTVKKKQSKVFAAFDRSKIEDGALAGKGLEICYVKNPVDAFFAQIQGSTRVKLDGGKLLRLNYIASNGHPYTPVGRFLVDRGIVAKEDMSMDKIRDFMESNPDEGKELRRKNRSFVFFHETSLGENDECIGAQGVQLTPLRSAAVDKSLHVYGTPVWVDAELPIENEKPETPFRRLLIAQDTGSAIIGPARADIYFGHGDKVASIAGRIKQFGTFVMLVPQSVSLSGADAQGVPLPKPRPKDIVAAAN
ncbi:MAG: MltA domain-containing protein [Pseudolabrys sp.]|nr:MltA domain-containing protein [Pseudolabrys sp.]